MYLYFLVLPLDARSVHTHTHTQRVIKQRTVCKSYFPKSACAWLGRFPTRFLYKISCKIFSQGRALLFSFTLFCQKSIFSNLQSILWWITPWPQTAARSVLDCVTGSYPLYQIRCKWVYLGVCPEQMVFFPEDELTNTEETVALVKPHLLYIQSWVKG